MWYFAAGDAGFYFSEQIKAFSWFPQVWQSEFGFGVSALPRLWFDYPYRLFVKILFTIGLSWWIIDKLLWIGMFALAFYSAFRLSNAFLKNNHSAILSAVIFSSNTYILLLFSGGQIGVALAYALAPLVLFKFISLIDHLGMNYSAIISSGLWFALLIAFDLRIALLVALAIFLYFFILLKLSKLKIFALYKIIFSFCVSALVHSYWLFPIVTTGSKSISLGEEIINPGMLKFLSVTDFSHTMGFLHPNWPENLFGKVYFMQPEFLLLPLAAFASLYFLNISKRENDKKTTVVIIYFSLIALVGIFLAKGVNEPFGHIYNWIFINIPGFTMYRDPTKFYLFISLGYAVLIPFALQSMIQKYYRRLHAIYALAAFMIFWFFSLQPIFAGLTTGNFKPPTISQEDIQFKNLMVQDAIPSRILWMPQEDAFSYFSVTHPLLRVKNLFPDGTITSLTKTIETPEFTKKTEDSGVGYIVVPADTERRIFLEDYKFSPKQRNDLIAALESTNFDRLPEFGNLAVFKNNRFAMKTLIPSEITQLQQRVNTGLMISALALLVLCIAYLVTKKRI